MVFSTPTFLFLFLPVVLWAYLLLPRPGKNLLLLAASLFFYAWGERWIVLVMLLSILGNYILAIRLVASPGARHRHIYLTLALAFNLGLLFVFKYANFFVDSLDPLLTGIGLGSIEIPVITLPIGISFFTFQALSYVIDVHRGDARLQRNPIDFALYIALFPQLIAGPIVRYVDVAEQIVHRTESWSKFSQGVERFVFGLAKKMIFANTAAEVADKIFALPLTDITPGLAWLGTACYTIQIYFDFSGYSDMAIGLGLMFGFRYLENFRHPYVARSITGFWRRWHISLSTWFRDYLYIPLGGNRKGPARTYLNLFLVFFLCGLWHGASWTFVVWGIYHGLLLVLERLGLGDFLSRIPRILQHLYAMLAVMIGWVLFRAETFEQAHVFVLALFGVSGSPAPLAVTAREYIDPQLIFVLVVGAFCSTPSLSLALRNWREHTNPEHPASKLPWSAQIGETALTLLLLVLLTLCTSKMALGTYNPFIYFRF